MTKVVIFANGKAVQVGEGITVSLLAAQLKLPARMILTELNGEVLPREAWDSKSLHHGDRIEFVRVVAGG